MGLDVLRESLPTTAAHPPAVLLALVGLTHASKVIPAVRSSVAASGMVTRELVEPLTYRALAKGRVLEYDLTQAALLIVPVLPLPEMSLRTVPAPWAKL